MRVLLGNPAAKEAYRAPVLDDDGHPQLDDDGQLITELRHRPLPGNRVTAVSIDDSYTLSEAFRTIADARGVWNNHSEGDEPMDVIPDWVESDREGLAALLADHFGCPVGRPKGWTEAGQ